MYIQQNSFDLNKTAYFDVLNILFIKLETSYLELMFPKHCRRSLKTK